MVKYKKGFQKDLHLQSDADMLHSHQSSKSDKDSSPIMLQAVAEKVKLAGKSMSLPRKDLHMQCI